MGLPKIDVPTFEMEQPSTGKTIQYRPFLVKEEKILLMALGEKEGDMLRAIKQIATNCILTKEFNINEATSYDIEYIFLQLRAKSVGETISLKFRHRNGQNRMGKKCSHIQEVDINIDDIKLVYKDKIDPKIKLTDTVGIKLKHPSMEVLSTLADDAKDSVSRIMALLRRCTEYIWDEEQMHKAEDATDEELKEFFDTLTSEQFKKIEDFFTSAPALEYQFEYTCKGCDEKTIHRLKGLKDFFV